MFKGLPNIDQKKNYFSRNNLQNQNALLYLQPQSEMVADRNGGMAEWSIAAVLKTVDCNRSGGSNPSSSAELKP